MTEQFASIELARLYESQGYLDDAIEMYRTLAREAGGGETVLQARQALARLENQPVAPQAAGPGPTSKPEKKMADLLEKWLMLMVVQKRVDVFKAIRSRL